MTSSDRTLVMTLLLCAALVLGACSPAASDSREPALAPEAWPAAIRALSPASVYTHNMNTVVVQRVVDGVEYGRYITRPESSYQPQSGDDGFTFIFGPISGTEFGAGCEVYGFQRKRD